MKESEHSPDLDLLWDFDDPAQSEARFRDASGRASGSARLECLTQIARAQGLQRRFDEANATLDEVEQAIHAQDPAALPRVRVRYLLERGRVLNSSGRAEEARPHFIEAFDRALLDEDDAMGVDAAHMVAIAADGDFAILWNERALALAESSKHAKAREWRGSLLNNLGWTRHGKGEFAAALDLFERALDARREQGKAKPIGIARWCVARCLRSLGRTEEALDAQQELERDLASAGEHDGFVSEEIGECLLTLGREDEARQHFARAHDLLAKDPWFGEREPARLARLRELGNPA